MLYDPIEDIKNYIQFQMDPGRNFPSYARLEHLCCD